MARGRKNLPEPIDNVIPLTGNTVPPKGGRNKLVNVPECPEPVLQSADAKEMWDRVTVAMLDHGLICDLFQGSIAAYCIHWGRLCEAERSMRLVATDADDEALGWLTFTPNNYAVQSPLLQVANKAMEGMRQWAGELGLTPAALAKVNQGMQMELPLDGFEDFLSNGKPGA